MYAVFGKTMRINKDLERRSDSEGKPDALALLGGYLGWEKGDRSMTDVAAMMSGLDSLSADTDHKDRIQATFWRSPFAVCAALVVCIQAMMLVYVAMLGVKAPYELLLSLTAIAAFMMTAGIWPDWNYLSITEKGVEQHTGLTCTNIRWDDVKAIEGFDHGVSLYQMVVRPNAPPYMRTTRIFNRYDIAPNRFIQTVDKAWRAHTATDAANW
ncbi:MAG: hypothetical protein AAF986_03165 [Pseudomonadota bacterium]